MFTSAIFADEAEARRLDKAVETELRQGRPDAAAALLDPAVAALEAAGHPLAALCRASAPDHLEVTGWNDMLERFGQLDNPDRPITAIGIDLSSHGDVGGDVPYLETSFYTDSAFPFSKSSRAELLDKGYDDYSAAWQGNFEDIDSMVRVRGFVGLSEGVEALVADCKWGSNANPLDHDAMRIGAALRALRVHQAIRAQVLAGGLPRPLTVIVGSNESAPFYDAPVVTPDELDGAHATPLAPAPSEPSDEIAAEPPEAIDPQMIVDAEPVFEAVELVAAEPEEAVSDDVDYAPLNATYTPPAPPPEPAVSGVELRRRLRENFAQADNDDAPAASRSGLLARMFSRR